LFVRSLAHGNCLRGDGAEDGGSRRLVEALRQRHDTTQQGGVLGAIAAVGQGSLLFTGFPLCIAVAAALGVIALGLTNATPGARDRAARS
jgi:hypothetical protein